MQFKVLALSAALAASASAQVASSSGINQASVYAVLATALPSSLVAEALTNPAAVSSEIASEFSAGITPSWFAALPTGIQTYLLGQASSVYPNATGILSNSTMTASNSSMAQVKTTTKPNGQTTVLTTGTGRNTMGGGNTQTGAAASASGSSSSSQGGAAAPTHVLGAGLAGALGLVGLLAL